MKQNILSILSAFSLSICIPQDAIHLDGGGSTNKGQPDEGVVTMPCDNYLFNHAGERLVSNIIVLKPKTQ